MHFSTTLVAILAVLPALIDAYHPFPVQDNAGVAAGHKMVKRRVGRRGCAVKASASASSAAAASAPTGLGAVQAIASPNTPISASSAVSSVSPVASSASAVAPQPTSGGGDDSLPAAVAGPFTGDATFYAPGLGACGETNNSGDKIVAVAAALFDQFPGNNGNPNLNPICNRKLMITYKGKTVEATVRDRCPGCAIGSLDMTESLFNEFAASSVGRLSDNIGTGSISWVWA